MKRLILLSFGALLSVGFSMEAYADKVCRGKVLDEQGEPLTGAVVRIPGAKGGYPPISMVILRLPFQTTHVILTSASWDIKY